VVRLIDDSRSGKAQARANGLASAAASVYGEASRTASYDARSVARLLGGRTLRMRVAAVDAQVGIARVRVTERGRVLADVVIVPRSPPAWRSSPVAAAGRIGRSRSPS